MADNNEHQRTRAHMKNLPGFVRWVAAALLATQANAATVSLVKDLNPDEVIASSSPWYLGVVGDRALFAGLKPREQAQRLFRTDGTAAGTVELAVTGLTMPR